MREILFRGKHKDSGEWKYGDLNHATYSGETLYWIIEPKPGTCFGHVSYAVEPSTVGQYIGLHDHAGNRIFEGDIVANYDQEEGAEAVGFPVVYHDAGFRVKYPGNGPPLYGSIIESRDTEYIEVIGNVHDNPELVADGMTP